MNSKMIWAILLLLLGGVLLLRSLGFVDLNLHFAGWWTLFIIIPCGNSLMKGDKHWLGAFMGLLGGILLLVHQQGWFKGYFSLQLVVAIAVILAGGIMLITSGFFGNNKKRKK